MGQTPVIHVENTFTEWLKDYLTNELLGQLSDQLTNGPTDRQTKWTKQQPYRLLEFQGAKLFFLNN